MERFLSSASKPAVGDGLVGDQTKLGVSDSSAVSHTSFHHVGPISLAQPDLTHSASNPFHPVREEHCTLKAQAMPFTPYNSLLEKCMDKLVDTNIKLTFATMEQNDVNRQLAISGQLPKITIPVFDGDQVQYPIWNSSFKALIDSKPMDTQTKLNFLSQYVSGKPKKVVEHFLLIGSEDAYKSAKALLHERYGNCNVISSALINKLEEWPKIGGRNAEALRDLSDFLQKIKAAKETLSSLAVLDFAKEYIKILAKLPYNIQNKWGDSIKQTVESNEWRR